MTSTQYVALITSAVLLAPQPRVEDTPATKLLQARSEQLEPRVTQVLKSMSFTAAR